VVEDSLEELSLSPGAPNSSDSSSGASGFGSRGSNAPNYSGRGADDDDVVGTVEND